MRLVSWNVNGIRAVVQKGHFFDFLDADRPDILCLQETKAAEAQLDETLLTPPDYYTWWHSGEKKGYSGTGTFSRMKPLRVERGQLVHRLDTEGRVLLTEYEDFTLYNIYFPNGQRDQERLDYKMAFYDECLRVFEAERRKGKPLVICGDVNTAHRPIDLKNPKENEKTSGFLPIERAWIDTFVAHGYVDTFRHFHPDAVDEYSWWTFRVNARARNIGWRIDYFFVTEDLLPRVSDAHIRQDVMGSDHAPVVLVLT